MLQYTVPFTALYRIFKVTTLVTRFMCQDNYSQNSVNEQYNGKWQRNQETRRNYSSRRWNFFFQDDPRVRSDFSYLRSWRSTFFLHRWQLSEKSDNELRDSDNRWVMSLRLSFIIKIWDFQLLISFVLSVKKEKTWKWSYFISMIEKNHLKSVFGRRCNSSHSSCLYFCGLSPFLNVTSF